MRIHFGTVACNFKSKSNYLVHLLDFTVKGCSIIFCRNQPIEKVFLFFFLGVNFVTRGESSGALLGGLGST